MRLELDRKEIQIDAIEESVALVPTVRLDGLSQIVGVLLIMFRDFS